MSDKTTFNKQKQKHNGNEGEEISLGKVSFGDKKLEFYFDVIKFPIILAIVINIVYFFIRGSFEIMWIFDILAFIYIATMVIKKKQGKQKEVFIACGIAGLFMGLFIAIFKFIYFQKFYLFFNLISEPFLTFFVGGFVGLAVAYMSLNLFKKNKKEISSSKKGGD
ncbi:hypothetical protein KJ705_03445 [Patescibacteria group bacterium]|nr:hypothetical protein [Patescibacteria group bacterium]MBU2229225.1 hypothetical protein [Patescibacteria group bacterium]MBU2236157.1 hypothetical protein [Patescibacteria group bacterium]